MASLLQLLVLVLVLKVGGGALGGGHRLEGMQLIHELGCAGRQEKGQQEGGRTFRRRRGSGPHSTNAKEHLRVVVPLVITAEDLVQRVGQQLLEDPERVTHSPGRSRKVDHEAVAGKTGKSS